MPNAQHAKKSRAPRPAHLLLLGGALLAALAGVTAPTVAREPDVQTVAQVDLQRYLGTWHEIAHFPMFFQRKCARDTQATYSLKPNGHITVDNQCINRSGGLERAVGDAWAVDRSNSRLKVTFLPKGLRWLPLAQGDYWVLKLDADYQVALVGTPDRKYLWILARQPQISDSVYRAYVDEAKRQGFDVSKLVRTLQSKSAQGEGQAILH